MGGAGIWPTDDNGRWGTLAGGGAEFHGASALTGRWVGGTPCCGCCRDDQGAPAAELGAASEWRWLPSVWAPCGGIVPCGGRYEEPMDMDPIGRVSESIALWLGDWPGGNSGWPGAEA